mgnify:CR=1 FL=1
MQRRSAVRLGGVHGHTLLEKPLDFEKLFSAMRRLLDEPEETRLARLLGRSPVLGYFPPVPGGVDKNSEHLINEN